MKIINDGKKFRKEMNGASYKLFCPFCGCEFLANPEDFYGEEEVMSVLPYGNSFVPAFVMTYTVDCPYCNVPTRRTSSQLIYSATIRSKEEDS